MDLNILPEDWIYTTGDGLRLDLTVRYESAVFERFFKTYDRAFVLPDEKEEARGFKAALDLNHGEDYHRLCQRFGPYREVCLTVHDQTMLVGGANFFAASCASGTSGAILTSNLNYIFVEQGARGKGYLRRMIGAIRSLVPTLFAAERPLAPGLMFVEQNDPFQLTPEQYQLDTAVSGVDQFDRLAIWGRAGARIVDHAYLQPPLSANQDVDDTLAISVIGAEGGSISSCVLADHLERFFAISVCKGVEGPVEENAAAQLHYLQNQCQAGLEVSLLDQMPLLAMLSRHADKFGFWGANRPKSLIEALREYAARTQP